ncbi:uncharacterized protein LOC130668578 [Microplitis mediator]|uniref:uncharacterized protein LOC130668578 n=1 Tax=Microplitis mediator TaxID=375433 RepID=UPI002552DD2B|nr:uncharacterized protein LOC130668578 [Microplitis mediator]
MDNKIFYRGRQQQSNLPFKVFEGYSYCCYKTVKDTSYLRCCERRSLRCDAHGKFQNGQIFLTTNHNHEGEPKLELYYNFQKALYYASISQPYQSLRLIYDNLSVIHYEAAIKYTWAKMQPMMTSWRRSNRLPHPPIPNDLLHYVTLLRMPQWDHLLRYSQGHLSVSALHAPDGGIIIIFFDLNFLASIITTTLFMDATFKMTPKKPKVYQFFTIMALINNKALPICWMLMSKKSASAYKTGLSYFKNHGAPHIQPQTIMSDFEASLDVAIKDQFPATLHTGCYFHFCQALIKRLKKLGLLRLVSTWKYGQIIIRKLMALALLPPNDALQGYNWLITNIPEDIYILLHEFFLYFYNQWIVRTPPTLWSVHGHEQRTNNFSESYHKKSNIRFGVHPNIWDFTENLTRLQAITRIEYESLQNGEDITRSTRSENLDINMKIKKAWDLYNNNILDIPSFLACASNFLRAFQGHIIDDEPNHQNNVADIDANNIVNNYDDHLIFLELNIMEIQ